MKSPLVEDPISRDMRDYAFMTACSLVGLVTLALMMGLFLKQDRKHTVPLGPSGCYVWSDGHVTCRAQ